MTESEICYMYRQARNKNTQLQILAELNNTNQNEIIRILTKNGEELTERVVNKLYNRLNVLDGQIAKLEREYKEIVRALSGCKDEI